MRHVDIITKQVITSAHRRSSPGPGAPVKTRSPCSDLSKPAVHPDVVLREASRQTSFGFMLSVPVTLLLEHLPPLVLLI